MGYIEFDAVFVEGDAPKVKSLCKLSSIEAVEINTAGDDVENTGDYFVWLTLSSGSVTPCFRGTLEACEEHYGQVKADILKAAKNSVEIQGRAVMTEINKQQHKHRSLSG